MALKEQPYRLLVKHIYTIKKCAHSLEELGTAYLKTDYKQAMALSKQISKLLDEADAIRKSAVSKIPKSIFMAISKHNILLLLRGLDKLAHHIEYGSTLLIARKTKVGTELAKKINAHLHAVVKAVTTLDEAILNVYKILKGELGKKDTQSIIDLVQEVIQHERQADVLHTELIRMLYGAEGDMDSLGIMHLLRAIDHIDDIANLAERTAIRLASVITE